MSCEVASEREDARGRGQGHAKRRTETARRVCVCKTQTSSETARGSLCERAESEQARPWTLGTVFTLIRSLTYLLRCRDEEKEREAQRVGRLVGEDLARFQTETRGFPDSLFSVMGQACVEK